MIIGKARAIRVRDSAQASRSVLDIDTLSIGTASSGLLEERL